MNECATQVQQFFTSHLGFQLNVDNIYSIGSKQPKPLIISLPSEKEKLQVLNLAKNLKDVKNRDGNGYYISEHLPKELSETKRRERDILRNNKLTAAHKVEISFFKGGLKIANETYRKKVTSPDPADILKLTEQDVECVLNIKLNRGEHVVTKDCTSFQAMTVSVQSHAEIRDAYMKMKLIYLRANHIICAYSIPGVDTYYSQDYCDDGEISAGRLLLKLLTDNNLTSKAIFAFCFAGKAKLGVQWFSSIVQAASNVLGICTPLTAPTG